MSKDNGTNGQVVKTETSAVATNDGTMVEVPHLTVAASRIYGFVEKNRKAYFEDHSLDYCLDEIISRGMAEITRQVKTAEKAAVNRASGELLKKFNLTPSEAAKLLATLQAQSKPAS